MYPGFVTCNDAIQKILSFPAKKRKLSWYRACAKFSKMQMVVNDYVHRSHRKIRLLWNFTTCYSSISQDQAFHALNVHRNDCCGLGTTAAGIVTDGRTAMFETFTPFRCLLRRSVSTPYCAWSLLWISAGFTPSFTRNCITSRCFMHALTLVRHLD